MKSFDEYVALAEKAHGHICAGQILGLRMALRGVKLLGLEDPAGRDRKQNRDSLIWFRKQPEPDQSRGRSIEDSYR